MQRTLRMAGASNDFLGFVSKGTRKKSIRHFSTATNESCHACGAMSDKGKIHQQETETHHLKLSMVSYL